MDSPSYKTKLLQIPLVVQTIPGTECILTDTGKRAIDVNSLGAMKNIYKGEYNIGEMSFSCMIVKSIEFDNYVSIKDFRHENAIKVENFYQESGQGRLVIGCIDGEFGTWVKKDGAGKLFVQGNDKYAMSDLFQNIIIQLCRLLENMFLYSIHFENLKMENLYVKMFNGEPILRVLPRQVTKDNLKKENWKAVRRIIDECCTLCGRELNAPFKDFCDFIGRGHGANRIINHPIYWDDTRKVMYMLSIMSGNRRNVQKLINQSGISWPSSDYIIQQILDHQRYTQRREYDEDDIYDYIRLIRNCYKHHNELPYHLPTVTHLLRHVEALTSKLWIDLYEVVDWQV